MSANMALSFPQAVFICNLTANERFTFQRGMGFLVAIASPLLTIPFLLKGCGSLSIVAVTLALNALSFLLAWRYSVKNNRMEFNFLSFRWGLLKEVWLNLLDNAAKFAAKGTTITVQITKKDGKAYTSIRNLGATIPPDELSLLFDRFHKADYSRSMDREGVGLGLYIVKTILGNLKENITVTSEDGVTNFTFTLTLA